MKKIGFCLVGLVAITGMFVVWFVGSSQIKPGGTRRVATLGDDVTIEEDALGVPTIIGKSIDDVVRAQGWILARDRFFQMDLIRRRSAGKLSEVFGAGALGSDKTHYVYGFSKLAERAVANLKAPSRHLLEVFAEGVNGFLEEGRLPLEIRVLGYTPARWTAADCVLVALSMYDPPDSEYDFNVGHELFSPAALRFFGAAVGFLDAPIIADSVSPGLPKVPDAKQVSLRDGKTPPNPPSLSVNRPNDGSNAFAISGKLTKSGKPILAGDPHLHLDLPNVWYRMKLRTPDLAVTGVTIPGIPGILIGSNGHIAWSFTNTMSDHADQVIFDSVDDGHYLVGKTKTAYVTHDEMIPVKGRPPERVTVKETVWGPVISDHGKDYALEWVALKTENYQRLEMLELNRAENLDQAFAALGDWSGPAFNAVLASADGHIGWTPVGHLPRRVGFDGSTSVRRDEQHRWAGFLPASEYPKVVDPEEGFIASANQRSIPLKSRPERFSTNVISPARAYRIREELRKRKDWDARGAYGLQIDVTSNVSLFYRDQLLRAISDLKDEAGEPWVAAISEMIKDWDGKISIDNRAYVLLKPFREKLFQTFLAGPLARIPSAEDQQVFLERYSRDDWMASLLTKRPMHLLPAAYPDFPHALAQIAVTVGKSLVSQPAELKNLKWGDRNRTEIRHPFSLVLPKFLSRAINLPEAPLAGDMMVPREGTPSHAASMRMVVDLSDSAQSTFNHAGGQSGHLRSAHYTDQFEDWVNGRAATFEPGPPLVSTLLTKAK